MAAGNRTESFGRVPSADRRNPVDDPETRRKARKRVFFATVTVTAAGIFVWLASLPFDDPPEIRKVVAAIVIGLGGAFPSVRVAQGMAEGVAASNEPPYEHVQPEALLVLDCV